jgi:hypothetical protein
MKAMQTFLFILMLLLALGALVALVRGIVQFLQTTEADLKGTGGPSQSGLRQNKMMWRRIQFQAAAVVVAMLFLLLSRPG